MKTFTITHTSPERDSKGYPTGCTIYHVTASDGVMYEAYTPHNGHSWQVATLAKRADGGRAWRWAKDSTKGVSALIVAHIEAATAPTPTPVNSETFSETDARICFHACVMFTGMQAAKNQVCGAVFKTAKAAFAESGLSADRENLFVQGYLTAMPKRVFVTRDNQVTNEHGPFVACVIGVGLIA